MLSCAQVPYYHGNSAEGRSPFSGKLARVPLDNFDTASVEVLDLAQIDGDLRGFVDGYAHGGFG